MGEYGGVREIRDELGVDKAGMRDTGGEGLKRRNCWDLLLATVEDGLPVPPLWAFTSISMRCPNILPRCRPELKVASL